MITMNRGNKAEILCTAILLINNLLVRYCSDYAIGLFPSRLLVVSTGFPFGLSHGVAISGFHRYSRFAIDVTI